MQRRMQGLWTHFQDVQTRLKRQPVYLGGGKRYLQGTLNAFERRGLVAQTEQTEKGVKLARHC